MVRTARLLAIGSQSANWSLKSAGEVEPAAGHERGLRDSRCPARRSPWTPGHRVSAAPAWCASVPMNAGHPDRSARPRADAGLVVPEQPSRHRAELPDSSCHIPANRSSVWRVGIITAVMNREIRGHHHQHRQQPQPGRSRAGSSPAGTTDRTAPLARPMHQPIRRIGRGVLGPHPPRRSPGTTMIDPVQPTRSAITVAGICGYSASNARIRGSNALNADDATGARSYFGGPSRGQRLGHRVSRDSPSCRAIARCDNPRCDADAGSTPSLPKRSPIQSDWVAYFSTVATGLLFRAIEAHGGFLFKHSPTSAKSSATRPTNRSPAKVRR